MDVDEGFALLKFSLQDKIKKAKVQIHGLDWKTFRAAIMRTYGLKERSSIICAYLNDKNEEVFVLGDKDVEKLTENIEKLPRIKFTVYTTEEPQSAFMDEQIDFNLAPDVINRIGEKETNPNESINLSLKEPVPSTCTFLEGSFCQLNDTLAKWATTTPPRVMNDHIKLPTTQPQLPQKGEQLLQPTPPIESSFKPLLIKSEPEHEPIVPSVETLLREVFQKQLIQDEMKKIIQEEKFKSIREELKMLPCKDQQEKIGRMVFGILGEMVSNVDVVPEKNEKLLASAPPLMLDNEENKERNPNEEGIKEDDSLLEFSLAILSLSSSKDDSFLQTLN